MVIMMIKKTQLLLVSLALATLTACTFGEPTDADIKLAVQQQYDAVNGIGGLFGVKTNFVSLNSVEKVGCEEIRDHVYRCDIVVDANSVMGASGKSTTNITMMKTKEGWAAVDN
jgi:hypothetical protein